jgi:hypothetical protein
MARWTAKLADERLQRQAALPDLRTRTVDHPAQQLVHTIQNVRRQTVATMDQVNLDNEEEETRGTYRTTAASTTISTSTDPRWRRVDRRMVALDTQMTASVHALATTRRQRLLALYDKFIYESIPQWMAQRTEESAVESELYSRLDALAGKVVAAQAQQIAQRTVLVQNTADCLTQASVNYRQRHVALKQAIGDLQTELETTRQARRAADAELIQRMQATQAALQRAVLAAVGDPDG